MLSEKPIFHQLTQSALDELARDGVICTPAEIVWLNHAAGQYISPGQNSDATILDFPMEVGNALLWPLSVGALLWIKRYAAALARKNERMELLVYAFAMAHSRQPEILHDCVIGWKTKLKIFWWAAGVGASFRELDAAVSALLAKGMELVDIPDKVAGYKRPVNAFEWGGVVALLCQRYPATVPEYWLWQASEEEVSFFLSKISSIMPAGSAPDTDGHSIAALGRIRAIVKFIKLQRREADAAGTASNSQRTPDAQPQPARKIQPEE